MRKYKAGDKVVLEIVECIDGLLCVSAKSGKQWFLNSLIEDCAKPLTECTEKLEKKNENKQKRIEKLVERLHRQASEITRLLAENAELKNDLEAIRDNAFEAGQVKGQNDAWDLAKKIVSDIYHGGYNLDEIKEMFGYFSYQNIWEDNTYTEAAAKVAEWERQKEICVGDVVSCEGIHGLVFGVGEVYIKGITPGCTPFQWHKQNCKKTGRHIDVDAWLAQIGGESDE